MEEQTGYEVLDEAECHALLDATPIGRVAFVADDRPVALPVNYRWHDGTVVFRSREGQKLHAAASGQHVCFEIDGWDTRQRTGWSVLVGGVANEVTSWAETEELEQLDLVPWSKGEWSERWVRITVEELSGRRFG
ncbi:MAG: pyridoxamine 5'-phosphate oxidase family protein [Acidimicrobiales bacterium]